MTCLTLGMSRPRAQTAVATKMGDWPDRNCQKTQHNNYYHKDHFGVKREKWWGSPSYSSQHPFPPFHDISWDKCLVWLTYLAWKPVWEPPLFRVGCDRHGCWCKDIPRGRGIPPKRRLPSSFPRRPTKEIPCKNQPIEQLFWEKELVDGPNALTRIDERWKCTSNR